MKGIQRNLYPGGNTPQGFYSYYNYILSQKKAEKIFCIKGGPGLGKSTLMRSIGNYFLNKGEDVDFLWCSSDAESLDGVLIKSRNAALVDGTAPHIVDPITPGAVDEIINLGEFWNEKNLRNNKNSIICSMDIIRDTFDIVYDYLACAAVHYDFMTEIIRAIIEDEVITETADKIINDLNLLNRAVPKRGNRKKLFASAITPGGIKNGLESMLQNKDNIIILKVPVGFRTDSITVPVSDMLVKSGLEIEEYYCPMYPGKKLEHIIIPSKKAAVISFNKYHSIENLQHTKSYSIDIEWKKNELKSDIYTEQVKEMEKNIMSAVKMLKHAKVQHDVLERYYIDAMDFSSMEEIKHNIIKSIERLDKEDIYFS